MAAVWFDPQFWFTPKILSSVIGVSLLLMGITGGDFQITSVKIPKIEGYWRVIASVSSIVFLLFGFGLLDGVIKSQTSSGIATAGTADAKPPVVRDAKEPAKADGTSPTQPAKSSTSAPATQPPVATVIPAETATPTISSATPADTVQITVSDSLGNDQLWETVDLKLGNYPLQRLSVTHDHRKSTATYSVPSAGLIDYQIDQTQMRSADGQTVHDQGTGKLNPADSHSFVVDGGVFSGQHRIFLRPSTH